MDLLNKLESSLIACLKESDLNKINIRSRKENKIRFHKDTVKILKLDQHLLFPNEVKNIENVGNLFNSCFNNFNNSIISEIDNIDYIYRKPEYRAELTNQTYSEYTEIELKEGLICLYKISPVIKEDVTKVIDKEVMDEYIVKYKEALSKELIKNPNLTEEEKALIKIDDQVLQMKVIKSMFNAEQKHTEEITGYTVDIAFLFKFKPTK